MEINKHKILALKYRPKNFTELIGQDFMSKTILNSIRLNKVPNAYLLTGIRGVGKTTTARIIAKALNCNKHFDHGEKLKEKEFCHCDEIANSKHLDIYEMDAASKTGIDDIRDLIESSKYGPTNAKYKIFIIDEVHMLSKQAFNGLLKTLEEPPAHLKFIFATTEVKKIPVTIISRCQRFDLNRVNVNLLFEHLKKISKYESGKISEEALKIIARASEGSVRDSLSLLDRALISANIENKEVDENIIRKILGIADRNRIIELLMAIVNGDEKLSIKNLREMINEGAEAKSILNDFLELIYLTISMKNLGKSDSNDLMSEGELNSIEELSKKVDISTLIIFWQFILQNIEELNIVSNQTLSLEMFIVRLLHLKDLPNYEHLLDLVHKETKKENNNFKEKTIMTDDNLKIEKDVTNTTTNQIKNIIQTKPTMHLDVEKKLKDSVKLTDINSFDQLLKIVSQKKEMELKYDLEKNVYLVKFIQGQIDISFNEKLNKNFIKNLSAKLFEWTNRRWVISLTKEKGQKTYSEQQVEMNDNLIKTEKKGKICKNVFSAFNDAELIEVQQHKKND